MAKVSLVEKNKRRFRTVNNQASKRLALKKMLMDKSVTLEERFNAMIQLGSLPRNGSKVRTCNRCEVSGRSHSVYRDFRLSRLALRELGSVGKIPGIIKSSW